jgi:mannose-6-phosphate isomerase-like protein (cupin superfamily)
VNLAGELATLNEPFRPKVIARANGQSLMVARTEGEFVWHTHPDADDCFLVLRGQLVIQMRDRDVVLNEGELFVVPRGVEHCPKADAAAYVLLIEPIGTVNTGDAQPSALTAPDPA